MSKLRINELESLETGRSLKVDEMAQTFDYEAGVIITSYNQTVRDSTGGLWRVSGTTKLPYTLTGAGAGESGNLVVVGDTALRADLPALITSKVETLSGLRSLNSPQPRVWVSGYSTVGDAAFGSNIFTWDALNTEQDNGGTIIKLDSVAIGRYILNYQGDVYPEWFGAVSGTGDSSLAIQRAVDALPTGGVLNGNNKSYTVKRIKLKSNMLIHNFRLTTLPGAVIGEFWSPITVGDYSDAATYSDITIKNVHVNGNRVLNDNGTAGGEQGGKHGFRFIGHINDLTVVDCSATLCASYGFTNFIGIYTGTTGQDVALQNNIKYINCTSTYNKVHGWAVDSLDGLIMTDCVANYNGTDIAGSGGDRITAGGLFYGNGIDIEGYGIESIVKNFKFTRCDFRFNAAASVYAADTVDATDPLFKIRGGFLFEDCKFSAGQVGSNTAGRAFVVEPNFSLWVKGRMYKDIKFENCDFTDGIFEFVVTSNVSVDGKYKDKVGEIGKLTYSDAKVFRPEYGHVALEVDTGASVEYMGAISYWNGTPQTNIIFSSEDGIVEQVVYSSPTPFAANETKTLPIALYKDLAAAFYTVPFVSSVTLTPDVCSPVAGGSSSTQVNVLVQNGKTAQTITVGCLVKGRPLTQG